MVDCNKNEPQQKKHQLSLNVAVDDVKDDGSTMNVSDANDMYLMHWINKV